ncbi:MAG: hypothetical protein JO363_18700 [Solirubrobacterales bacterium]|nr:hypothetical protein [Solirubrobacterales bacterium]
MVWVRRLSARASLDDSPAALAHATAQADSGDESWEQWVAEYRRGEALVLRLELTLELGDEAGEVITASRDGFFVENHAHAPKVEQQIAELASGDLTALAAELTQRGHELDVSELGAMYVHVELDADVRQRVQARGAAA